MQEYLAVMPGDAYPLWIHRASQNHVPCVIIISGRVVGKAAFYRFLVIVSTIIYSAYPPEKRLVSYFCSIHDCHKRPVSAASGSYQSSFLL